VDTSEVLHLEH
jgi:hypothetical protein